MQDISKLNEIKISHSWFGTVAYTFDELHTQAAMMEYITRYTAAPAFYASYLETAGQKVIGAKKELP